MEYTFPVRTYRRIQRVMLALTLLIGFAPFLHYLWLPGVLRPITQAVVFSNPSINWFQHTVLFSNLSLIVLVTLTCWGGHILSRMAQGVWWERVAMDSLLLIGLQMILLWAQINAFHPKQ